MLTALPIKEDIYWVGGTDWNERNFHGFSTECGITYNAYLIMDEHITLVDTTKPTFAGEMIERIKSVVDPSKIEYIISNHVETDHSGGIPAVLEYAPNATVVTSAPKGLSGLTSHYGELNYMPVKTGDTLEIGKRTLSFVQTPFVHWPDNMVTWSESDKVLFSNDAFGQHYATSRIFDDENDLAEALNQARRYYANIVQCYKPQTRKALDAIRDTIGYDNIEIIATAHGVCWRSHIKEIVEAYEHFASDEVEEKAIVVYDSLWGGTGRIAKAITDAFIVKGVPVKMMDLKDNHISDVMSDFMDTKYIVVGSPTYNGQMMPNVAGFLTYMKGLSPKNGQRIAMAFGDYGWAPAGPKNVHAELETTGFQLPEEPLAVLWQPGEDIAEQALAKVEALLAAGE